MVVKMQGSQTLFDDTLLIALFETVVKIQGSQTGENV